MMTPSEQAIVAAQRWPEVYETARQVMRIGHASSAYPADLRSLVIEELLPGGRYFPELDAVLRREVERAIKDART